MRKICLAVLAIVTTVFVLTACKSNTYTITFHTNGGSEVESIEYNENDENIYFPISEKPGYTLVGWYNNSSWSGTSFWSLPKGASGNLEYWAKWEIASYDINYNLSGGTLPSDSVREFTMFEEEDITLPVTASRNGYLFEGWFDNAQLSGEPVTSIAKGTYGDQNLWPKWKLEDYQILFETNGGDEVESLSYNIQSSILLPETQREYYDFGGWFDNADLEGNTVTNIFPGNFGVLTFYAKWIPDLFDIEYELNGGDFQSGDNPPVSYTIEGGVALISPVKDNVAFTGWYDNADFDGNPISVIPQGFTGTLTLYAEWKAVEFTISYVLDGGILSSDYPQGYDSINGVTLVSPTKAGFVFMGWYDNADFSGNVITEIGAGESGNKKFWAKWQRGVYNVKFILNGGTGASDYSYTYGDATKQLPRPTRAGAVFEGWFASANFTGSPITELAVGSIGDKTYHAKWSLFTYVVTFELFGGSLGSAPTEIQFTVDNEVLLPVAPPTKTGYTFIGWFDDAGSTMPSTGIKMGTVGNRRIYANWEANSYSINYTLNGGAMPAEYITSYTYDEDTILPIPTRPGYDFGGWYETANPTSSTTGKLGMLSIGTIGDKTLHALWLSPLANANTVKMEAENTDLLGVSGPGYSGSQEGENRIQEDPDASNGKVVGWTLGPGVYVHYEFTLDRAINSILTIGLGSEIGSVVFNPDNLRMYVNGVEVDWGSLRVGGQNRFGSVKVPDVLLLAGKNTIVFEVLDNDLLEGFDAGGPLYDYISVEAKANIGWNPIYY